MRKKILFIILIMATGISCEKYQFQDLPDNPAWLVERISELEASKQFGIRIDVYVWNEAYYYHFMNLISSCWFCDFWDYYGSRYEWQPGEMEDFFENGRLIGTTWKSDSFPDWAFQKVSQP